LKLWIPAKKPNTNVRSLLGASFPTGVYYRTV